MNANARTMMRIGQKNGSKRGFTLIELLTVMVISVILTLVAIPAYRSFMAHTNRSGAESMLLQAAMWLERNQVATYTYATDVTGAPVNNAKLNTLGLAFSPATGTVLYSISFAAGPTSSAFVLVAIPSAAQLLVDGACPTLALDNMGNRGFLSGTTVATSAASDACWR